MAVRVVICYIACLPEFVLMMHVINEQEGGGYKEEAGSKSGFICQDLTLLLACVDDA